jgi:hypothetical protein
LRQVGLAIGVAVFIAVLGSPGSPAATLSAYQRAWVVTAAMSLAGALVALRLLTGRQRAHVDAPAIATSS